VCQCKGVGRQAVLRTTEALFKCLSTIYIYTLKLKYDKSHSEKILWTFERVITTGGADRNLLGSVNKPA
jgi:hypothetical protein